MGRENLCKRKKDKVSETHIQSRETFPTTFNILLSFLGQ